MNPMSIRDWRFLFFIQMLFGAHSLRTLGATTNSTYID